LTGRSPAQSPVIFEQWTRKPAAFYNKGNQHQCAWKEKEYKTIKREREDNTVLIRNPERSKRARIKDVPGLPNDSGTTTPGKSLPVVTDERS